MSKRILVIVFTVCLAIVGMTVMAIADTVSGNGWSLDTSTGVLTISSDTGTSDWYNKGRVQYRESVKSVVIESGVATICDSAFYNCTKLASVTIPSSVTSIGDGAFEYCSSLTSITIPSGVTSIEASTFAHSGITSITIPSSVTSIGDGAFEYCESLTSISIPSGVTSIEASAFAQSGLTSITIPSSATSIGTYAFYGCLGLTSVTIPSGVTSIGIYAFYGCTNLTSVKLESCKTEIGNKAFDNTAAYTNGNIVTSHSLTRVETQEATCTKAGNSEYFYCSECGGYFSDTAGVVPTSLSAVTIAATGHQNVTHFVANDPTCTEAGNIEYWYCSDCKCYFSDADCTQEITQAETITSALGHTLQHFEAVEAGCDTVGNVEYWYCGDCDTYFSDADATAEITLSQTVVAATGEHEYEVSAIVWNYEDGTATVKCLECGEYHTFDATVTSKNVLGQTTYTITTTINGTEYTDTKTTGTSLMMVQASYSTVTAAIEKANSLNPDDYENFSAVTDAINAVDWSLSVLNQKQVNSYAEAIEEAINNLVLAETVNITEETIEVIDPVEAGETDGE